VVGSVGAIGGVGAFGKKTPSGMFGGLDTEARAGV
jgi:hypothetical protein